MELGDDDNLNSSMGHFEAALVKAKIDLKAPKLERVLLAVDRSNQDPTAIALAAAVAMQAKATVSVVLAEEGGQTSPGRDYVIECVGRLKERGATAEALTQATTGLAHQQILAAREAVGAQLIVVPAPYARDINVLGDESLSSAIDALLAESKAPLLLVRHPREDIASCLKEVVVAATLHVKEAVEPARWALSLTQPEGQLTLLAVADRDTVAEAAALLGEQVDRSALNEEALKRAELRAVGALASAIQQRGAAANLQSTVDVRAGKPAAVIAAFADERHCLVCVGRSDDRTSPAYHHTVDLILKAHHPVLVA
jgi:hypothetical protein